MALFAILATSIAAAAEEGEYKSPPYAQAERAKDCIKMLKWLEKEDDAFADEKG